MTAGEPQAATRGSARVLVIDVDEAFAVELRRLLDARGYDCTVVSSAEEGLQVAVSAAWDVVLIDARLAETSGIDLLARIVERDPLCAVIVTGERDDAQAAVDALRGGAVNYLTRPASVERVLVAVDEAWERRRLRVVDRPLRLADVIRRHVLVVFGAHGDNVTRAARALGISRVALRRRLREYGAKPPSERMTRS